jgi:hypothetical protein
MQKGRQLLASTCTIAAHGKRGIVQTKLQTEIFSPLKRSYGDL